MSLILSRKPFLDVCSPFFSDIDKNLTLSDEINFVPKSNVYEDNKAYYIEVELPGVDKKDIKIEVNGSVLTVKGQRKNEVEEKDGNSYRFESSYGEFQKSWDTGDNVNVNEVNAKSENGIYKITLPKKKEAQKEVRTIEIQ